MVKKSSMKFCYTILAILFLFLLNEVAYAAEAVPDPARIAQCNANFINSLNLFKRITGWGTNKNKTDAILKTGGMTYKESKIFLEMNPSVSSINVAGGIGKFFITSGIDWYWKSAEYEQRERHAVHDQRLKEITAGRDGELQIFKELEGPRKDQAIDYIQDVDHRLIDRNIAALTVDDLKKLSKLTKNEELRDIYETYCEFELNTKLSTYDKLFLDSSDYENFIDEIFNDANNILNFILNIADSPKHSGQLTYDDYTTIRHTVIQGLFKRSSTISRICVNNIERMGANDNSAVIHQANNISELRSSVEARIKKINRRGYDLDQRFKVQQRNLQTKSIHEKHNPTTMQSVINTVKNIFTSEKSANLAATAAHTSATVQHLATTAVVLGIGGAIIYAIVKSVNK